MHLEEHPRPESSVPKLFVDLDHGQLDEIGRSALEGRVDRRTLGEAASIGILTVDVRNRSRPSEKRFYLLIAPGFLQYTINKGPDTGIFFKVRLNKGLASRGSMPTAAQSKGRDAIDDAKVHSLRAAPMSAVIMSGGTPKTWAAVKVWMSSPRRNASTSSGSSEKCASSRNSICE